MRKEIFRRLPELKTRRLRLRRLRLSDAESIFAYASDADVARYTSWEAHKTITDTRRFLRQVLKAYRNNRPANWGLVQQGADDVIGTCGYTEWNPYHARAEIGYALGKDHWNRGLMTEAVRRVIDFGFQKLELNRIQATCLRENTASAKVMEKCGMRYEGFLRGYFFAKERHRGVKMYAILRTDWSRE